MEYKLFRWLSLISFFICIGLTGWLVKLIYDASNGFLQAFVDTDLGRSATFISHIHTLVSILSISFILFLFSNTLKSPVTYQYYWQPKKRISTIVTSFLLLLITYFSSSQVFIFVGKILTNQFRYQIENITVSGTGSMYPTFPKGEGKTLKELAQENVGVAHMLPYPNGIVVSGARYFGHEISRGDIVVFENDKTAVISNKLYGEASGFLKRVVAIPGDTVELRDGLVSINNKTLSEPYIARARSTFGGISVPECKQTIVPPEFVLVMGDNRKASNDSRHELGLVSFSDITHVLPLSLQVGTLDKNWRDTEDDLSETAKIKIDKTAYLKLINETRKSKELFPLTYNATLELAAVKRGQNILRFDDFSNEATKSGYTMEKAMQDAGYTNTIWGEMILQGHYEADELFENLQEQTGWQDFIANADYDDFALAQVEGNINGCPTQVIVQQFGGFVPPNYSQEVIDNWKKALENLKNVQPSWLELKTYPQFYDSHKQEVDRINEIIEQRIRQISQVVLRMENNEWLTDEETTYTKEDAILHEEQNSLAQKLNNFTQ